MGYTNNNKTWEQEQYERERRILNQKTRIAKAKQQK